MRKHTTLALFALGILAAAAQQPSTNWTASFEPPKRFIENKSQFDGRSNLTGSEILYAVDWGATQIYFTKEGVTYCLAESKIDEEAEKERKEKIRKGILCRGDEKKFETVTDNVRMRWLNANPDVEVTGLEEAGDYFSYAVKGAEGVKNINHIKGFHKLLYRNLYPNIDLEYTFHPEGGIKYAFILHPGADMRAIRMIYSHPIKVEREAGRIHIETLFGDIIDHRPHTFYGDAEKLPIPSRFNVSGDTISFKLAGYDRSKTIVIDPWTVLPGMPNANKAYYIKTDDNGNAYVYGGDSPYRLKKYNVVGGLEWTYNAAWDSSDTWFGALAVDPAGNSYITAGSVAEIAKIDSAGGLVWTALAGITSLTEYWALAFNCDHTQLLVGGTGGSFFPQNFLGVAYEINMSNGAILDSVVVAHKVFGTSLPFYPNEIRSMCSSPNGNYYFLTHDTIGSLAQNLSINYRQLSSYNLSYYLLYGQGGTGQGINGICATSDFIYTTDGLIIHKRDINTGNILITDTIPNGNTEMNSGIAVDDCGNVYAGTDLGVVKFDSNLGFITSASISGAVYDVTVTGNGDVLACGNGFVQSLNMSACAPISGCASLNTRIAGNIRSETGIPIRGTTVTLSGTSGGSLPTGINGQYDYNVVPSGSYTVTPSKSNDVMVTNGISTLDILLMRRHILGTQLLGTPYKIIAADVDGSQSVSTLDVLQTRAIILGNTTSFPGGKLWAFVRSDFVFANQFSPFPFDNFRSYTNVTISHTGQDFIGMKLGDVNDSWDPSILKTRATGEVGFMIDDYNAMTGDIVTVPVKVKDFAGITGYQFTLSWNADVLSLLEVKNKTLQGFYGEKRKAEGLLTTSWNDEAGEVVTLEDGSAIFELRFILIGEEGSYSEIEIGSQHIWSEAYDEQLQLLDITAEQGRVKVSASAIFNEALNDIDVYPNPTDGLVTIQIPSASGLMESVQLKLYDAMGKDLTPALSPAGEERGSSLTLDLKELPGNIFFLSIVSEAGKRVIKVAKY